MSDARVLIVDDEEPQRTLVANVLEQEGFAIAEASNPNEAKILLDQNVYDIAVVDIVMGDDEKAGIKLLKQILERGVHTKVILLTGHGAFDTAMRAVNIGAFGYIEKPVYEHRAEFLQRVNEALKAIRDEARKQFVAYEEIFQEIWNRTVGLVGPITLSAIFRNVLAEIEERHPCLSDVVVSMDGVSIEALLNSRRVIDAPQCTRQGLNQLIAELVRFLADLTGEESLKAVLSRPALQMSAAVS